MLRLTTAAGVTVSYDRYGSGPPRVLVHGSFSDHASNWANVRPQFERQFTVHAVARRGRGQTDASEGHGIEDEGRDVAAVIQAIDEPVFLLGHSYGAQTALAAVLAADRIRKLVLYEPPGPHIFPKNVVQKLEKFAQAKDWESFAITFFHEILSVPQAELDGLRMPVLLQVGGESPHELYVTDALAAVLPDARIEALPEQAHEGMTTAPEMYAEAVTRFLLS